jgi:hypothetical protein
MAFSLAPQKASKRDCEGDRQRQGGARAKWEQLEAARNEESRELRYDDFIRDVYAMKTIANRYRQTTAK